MGGGREMKFFWGRTSPRISFTLLELLIVIIVLGVLTSIGLPRLMRLVRRVYAVEGMSFLTAIHKETIRCLLMRNTNPEVYDGRRIDLDICFFSDPPESMGPNVHFEYAGCVVDPNMSGPGMCYCFLLLYKETMHLEPFSLDILGLMHCNYNPVGTLCYDGGFLGLPCPEKKPGTSFFGTGAFEGI